MFFNSFQWENHIFLDNKALINQLWLKSIFSQLSNHSGEGAGLIPHRPTVTFIIRRFYPKRLTVHSGYIFFVSMCVPWELNPQPFALLTQCSTTEPQERSRPTNNNGEVNTDMKNNACNILFVMPH